MSIELPQPQVRLTTPSSKGVETAPPVLKLDPSAKISSLSMQTLSSRMLQSW